MGGTMNFKFFAALAVVAFAASMSIAATAPVKKSKCEPQKPETCKSKSRKPIIIPPMNPPPVNPPRPGQPTTPGTIPTLPDLPGIPAPGIPDGRHEPGVPFPMSSSLPFPWDKIEGIWTAKGNGVDLIFSFEVQTDRDGVQFLSVEQIDAKTGELVAQGVGLSVENDKLVRAAMSGSFGGAYMLFIGSYKDPNSLAPNRIPKSVTVLTVRSFSNIMGEEDEQFTVSKVSSAAHSSENSLPNRPKNN